MAKRGQRFENSKDFSLYNNNFQRQSPIQFSQRILMSDHFFGYLDHKFSEFGKILNQQNIYIFIDKLRKIRT